MPPAARWEGARVPFNGSTERALKGAFNQEETDNGASSIQRLNRENTESDEYLLRVWAVMMFHSTAQQREH